MSKNRTPSAYRRRRVWTDEAKAAQSLKMKAWFAAKSPEQQVAHHRQQAANMMIVRPDIAVYPERWLAEAMRADA